MRQVSSDGEGVTVFSIARLLSAGELCIGSETRSSALGAPERIDEFDHGPRGYLQFGGVLCAAGCLLMTAQDNYAGTLEYPQTGKINRVLTPWHRASPASTVLLV